MKLFMFLLLIPIWVCSFPLFAAPLDDMYPEPPVAYPLLPTQKDPFSKSSSDLLAHSPADVAEVKVVHHQNSNKNIVIALVVSSSLLAGICLLLFCFSIYRLKKLKKYNAERDCSSDTTKGIPFRPILEKLTSSKICVKKGSIAAIEYQLLVAATNNFGKGNILGEGGSGHVYKARFSEDFNAAVKKLYAGGKEAEKEFKNEVELLSKIQHQNIISLIGYCLHGEARFLVYEMMENGSLDFHLHGPSRKSKLSWHQRMKIALDIARGLEYLHEHCNPPIIHRDLKTSNILLDSNFNAKLSDFGLAITGGNSNKTNIKVSGTLGYVAPERPVERVAEGQCQSIVTWAMPQLTNRSRLPNIVDPAIKDTMDLKHLYQVAAIAVLCVQQEPSYRPLITDVLHSFIPLVPVDLGGSS
ncbi:hypothetical protein ACJIZ3_005062 [Penstemon smallii]|uniref:Protein kinase domain-containing protein n=1 Tax=Penstemon smallii TaxID=265156 RepID=A0ABD3S415_9LAMI